VVFVLKVKNTERKKLLFDLEMAEFSETLETKGQKMEVDYSGTVDKKIPYCEALAAVIWLCLLMLSDTEGSC